MRIGSLFSGYGGLDLAVAAHYGGRVVWHVENDKAACRVLAARWPGVPNLGDVTTINWESVRLLTKAEHTSLHAEEVVPSDTPAIDILTAGYP